MILAVDVHYTGTNADVAGITFENWQSEHCEQRYFSKVTGVGEYESGKFYKRELQCILQLITEHNLKPTTIVVDGYVYLSEQKPGLGKYLYDALQQKVEIIGVAKREFSGVSPNSKILRGQSEKPLFISTTGDLAQAKENISQMHGNFRHPYLLKLVDQLCREQSKE